MKASVINQLCIDYHERFCFEFLNQKPNNFTVIFMQDRRRLRVQIQVNPLFLSTEDSQFNAYAWALIDILGMGVN